MKFILSKELPFISDRSLRSGTLEKINGIWVIRSGDYKQLIKESEYEEILLNATNLTAPLSQEFATELEEKGIEVEDVENVEIKASEETKIDIEQLDEEIPLEERLKQLQALNKRGLVEVLNEYYNDVDENIKKADMIDLVIDAEYESN